MKNKEIEELLNMLKKCAREDKATLKLNEIACKTILSYIEQLEKENKKYKDLGFEHLCKRNEQLEKENKILRENAEHNDKVVDKVNWEINILKNNRDKTIKYVEVELSQGGERELRDLVDGYEVLKILKGGSDESRI